MTRHREKNYYAVVKGSLQPAICDSWAVASPLVTGVSNNKYKGFKTLEEAKEYMMEHNVVDPPLLTTTHLNRAENRLCSETCYVVANGKIPGIYAKYEGGAEKQVSGFSLGCHKKVQDRAAAEKFLRDHETTIQFINEAGFNTRQGDPLNNSPDSVDELFSRLTLDEPTV